MNHPETVKVKVPASPGNPAGVVIINKEDFVEGQHELFDESAPKQVDTKKVSVATPVNLQVEKTPAIKQPWEI